VRISAALAAGGEYYERYSYYKDDVGMAWHTPRFIEELVLRTCPRHRLVHYGGGEHDLHQDVFVFHKSLDAGTDSSQHGSPSSPRP
jgi:hypothetical protein